MMAGKRMGRARVAVFLFVVFLAAQICITGASADDADLLNILPGPWIFTAYTEEQTEGDETPEADLAFLTLEENGKMSLLCKDKDGGSIGSLEGTWSFELVSGGMDRLTLLFTSTDQPSAAGSEYRMVCVYDIYAESWVEEDIQYTYLILEQNSGSSASLFAEVYGKDGESPIALHREQGPNMKIVNCKDYVSLRENRSKSSARLAKVPLGASVLAFPEAGEENGFILCVYHDEYGYILAEYLQPAE